MSKIQNSPLKMALTILLRALLMIVTLALLLVIGLCMIANMIFNGPSPAARDLLTMTLLEPSATKWIPAVFMGQELVDQIRAAEDPIAKFEELANEYSEDPGRETNPTGYIYTPGTMVAEFEEAAAGLMPGEISDPVQSDYGFHIILRRDLVAAIREDEARKVEVAREYLDQLLIRKRSASEVVYEEVLKTIDWTNFYKNYIAEVEKLGSGFGAN